MPSVTSRWEFIKHGDCEAAIIDILRNFTPELASYNLTVSGSYMGYTLGDNWITVMLEGEVENWPAIDKPRIDLEIISHKRSDARDIAEICKASIKRAMGFYWGHGLFLSDAKVEQGLTRVPDPLQEDQRYVIAFRLTTRPFGNVTDVGNMIMPFLAHTKVRYQYDSAVPYDVLYSDPSRQYAIIQRSDAIQTDASPFWTPWQYLTVWTGGVPDWAPGSVVKWLTDPRFWVVVWADGGYAGVYDRDNPTSYAVFYESQLSDPNLPSGIVSTDPIIDYTFADTTGGPVYSYNRITFFQTGIAGCDVFVDTIQAWQSNPDNISTFLKWYKHDPGDTEEDITYSSIRGVNPYVLACADLPTPQGTLDSLSPDNSTFGNGDQFVTVTGTGSGFTPDNVVEVYFSDQPDSGGFALAATYVDANTITFDIPRGNQPNPFDQNYANNMYVRMPNPGGPANTGVLFTFS